MEAVFVPESLPFGTESMETQILTPEELQLAANAFQEVPDLPPAPQVPSLYIDISNASSDLWVKCFCFLGLFHFTSSRFDY